MRTEAQPTTEQDKAAMSQLADSIQDVIEGKPVGAVLSVLCQMVIGYLPDGENLTDGECMARLAGVMGLLNIMQAGKAQQGYDLTALAGSVKDLSAIVGCGSRPLMIPTMAAVLVASVANGQRNSAAQQSCAAEITAALGRFEKRLVSKWED